MQQWGKFAHILHEEGPWDTIIDFIGFHAQFTNDTIRALRPKREGGTWAVNHYIHISTDSMYQAMPLLLDSGKPLLGDCCV